MRKTSSETLSNLHRAPCTSLVAQTVKRLSTMREIRVQSLGWEDPLEKEMAIHSSTIAWKIPWTEEPGRLQSMGLQSQTRLSDFTSTFMGSRQQYHLPACSQVWRTATLWAPA